MNRISFEDASNFISLKEDFTEQSIKDVKYFTISPSKNILYPQSEGWEDVNYYTGRRKDMFSGKGEGDQWVYVLSNPSLPNILKIGYTKFLPEVRASQISSATGVVLPYKVEWGFKCFNGEQLEGEVHRALEIYRVNTNREFFQVSLNKAKEVITELGNNYIS